MAKSRNVANLIAANLLPASNTITTSMLTDSSVTNSKIASTAVSLSKIDNSITTLLPITITGVSVTNSSYTVQPDVAVSPLGGYIKLTGTGFTSGCQVYINNTPALVSTYVSATEVRAQVPAFAVGYYHIYVQNTNGQAGLRLNGLYVSTGPSWTTSGTIAGSVNVPFGLQLAATSDSAVTYTLAAGSSLPSGFSLTSLGYLSGTVSSINITTIYSFDIVVTDSENQTSTRTFTLTITVSEPNFPYTSLLLLGNNAGTTTQNNTFVDYSINAVVPTRVGNVTQGSFSPFSQTGWSTYFNGSTDYLTVPTNAAFQFGTGDFTVECWLYKSAAANGPIVDARGSATAIPWAFYVDASNFPYFYDGTSLTSTVAIVNNQWNHIVAARLSGVLKIFVNGVQGYSNTVSTALNPAATVYIGGQNFTTSVYTSGYISNLRIVKGQALYTANFTPATSSLTTTSQGATAGNVSLLASQTNRHKDNSNNNFTVTSGGTPSIQSFSPFTPSGLYSQSTTGGSMYFDGNGDNMTVTNYSAIDSFGTLSFTVECWIYITSLKGYQAIITKPGATDTNGWILGLETNNTLSFYAGNGSWAVAMTGAQVPTVNCWHHVAVTRDSGTNVWRMFYDGVQINTVTNSLSMNSYSAYPLYIGKYPNFPAYAATMDFSGYIADVRIIKGTVAYIGNFTPPTGPLTTSQNTSGNIAAVTSSATSILLIGNNAGIFDSTAKNSIETVGSVATQTTVFKYGGAAINFPGSSYLLMPNTPLLNLAAGPFTIEAWVYLAGAPGNNVAYTIASNYSGTTSSVRYWWLGITTGTGPAGGFTSSGTGTITFATTVYGTNNGSIYATPTWTYGQWNHIAVCRDSSNNWYMFFNGTSVSTTTGGTWSNNYDFTNTVAQSPTFCVGGQPSNTGSSFFVGYMDDVRITKGVARYTANFTAPIGELTAN